jgi:plastocyanin
MKKRYVLAAFVFTASILSVACGGSSADLPKLATEAANVQPQSEQTVVAKNMDFDTSTIVVPALAEITITFENQDSNALHNIAIYEDDDGSRGDEVYRGELFNGTETRTYTFTAPEAGVYLFRCDAHPDMNGAFIAR